jgi:gliding motility-associated-like protein
MQKNPMYLLMLLLLASTLSLAQTPIANFTANKQSGCAPLIVSFQDQSTGNPTSWNWNFGNGATSTLRNPSTTYLTPGNYTVTLTVSNANGSNTKTVSNYITVYDKPQVNFSANTVYGCAPLAVQFTNLTNPGAGTSIATSTWDFGNGTTSTASNPSYTYGINGSFSVTLIVVNDKGCVGSLNKPQYITVLPTVNADFSFGNTNTCQPPFPISFTNASTGQSPLSYQWNFGDGATATQQNPVHNFLNTGNFNVTLISTSSTGCKDTVVKTVNIPVRTTGFTAPDTSCVGQPIVFNNNSVPAPTSAAWNFGDATTSTAINPVKTYSNPGSYTINLVNTYNNCVDSVKKTIIIQPKLTASFIANKTKSCKPPFTVDFSDLSFANPVSWLWNFGDGTYSTLQHPSHTYTGYGIFNVTLTVINAAGCKDSITKSGLIQVQRPVITLNPFNKKGCVPFTIMPTANINTIDNITGYLWSFGDGGTSTSATPVHTYTAQGTYPVSLTITTSTGCTQTFNMTDSVKVGTRPNISFTGGPSPVCAKVPVAFVNLTSPADQYLWLFGDGGSSTEQNPNYPFVMPGTFDVTLIATNNGCKDTLVVPQYITVLPPVAKFTARPDCNNRKKVTFTDNSIQPLTWFWDFGDGTTSTSQNNVHIYPALGSYNVTLIVTNGSCADTITKTVQCIDENPDFNILSDSSCRNTTVFFNSMNYNTALIRNFIWNFGDGGTAQGANYDTVTHKYVNAGNYNVKLLTVDLNGCRDSIVKNNFIRINGPKAKFDAINRNGCAGLTTIFRDSSIIDGIHPIASIKFIFGDGTSQVFNTPPYTHRYDSVGTFSVTMIAFDVTGCSDTITIPNYIKTTKPAAAFYTADTLACPGMQLKFQDRSTGTGLQYRWTFGDGTGNFSTTASPVYYYYTPGLYSVSLKITDNNGCSDSLTKLNYIKVEKPVSSFTMSDSISLCPPFKVNFTNNSSYYNNVKWIFGDGSNTTILDPVHYYTQVQSYTVSLIAFHKKGCSDTSSKTVTILNPTNNSITYNPLVGCKPHGVSFTTVGPTTANFNYTWDFGNGVTDTASGSTNHHVYSNFGNYIPSVIISDQNGCVKSIKGVDTIRIKGSKSNFGADKTEACLAANINFIDSTISNDPIASYAWLFGDGNSSTQHTPSHYYANAGTYTVTLSTITLNGCKDTATKPLYIHIYQEPQIDIGGDTGVCIYGSLNHQGLIIASPDTSTLNWQWIFPNGNNASQQNPAAQTYNTAGDFTVTALVSNHHGCKDTATKNIHVYPLPTSTMPDEITKIAGTPIQIPASYSSNVNQWNWDEYFSLSCNTCPQPVANPMHDTMYIVEYTDRHGCKNRDSIWVKVMCPGTNLFIPNTFSPNGDGSNDVFYPRGKGIVTVDLMRIFNRWGEIVYEKQNFMPNDAGAGWNGTFKGKKAQSDVYIYQCKAHCENGQVITVNGNITLIK